MGLWVPQVIVSRRGKASLPFPTSSRPHTLPVNQVHSSFCLLLSHPFALLSSKADIAGVSYYCPVRVRQGQARSQFL